MATPLLGLYAPSDGSDAGTWGSSWNSQGSTYLDNLIAGLTTKSLSSSNVTLSAAEARTQMLRLTGTLLANITIDAGASLWYGIRCVENLTSGAFTVALSNAGTAVIPQGRRCLVFIDSANGPRIIAIAGSGTADPVPAGSKTIWYNTAAPSGWTAVALNDYAIKIVTAGSGGVTSGSVAYSTLYARTATDSYALLTADIPSHQHFTLSAVNGTPAGSSNVSASNYADYSAIAGGTDYQYAMIGTATVATVGLSSATGGGGSHSHNIDMRVNTAAFTLASRD